MVLSYVKLAAINLALILLLLVGIDLAVTLPFFERSATDVKLTCSSSLTLYDYCPGVVQFRHMDTRDRLLPVYNYIDDRRRSRYRSPDLKPGVTRERRVFLIGDSFIQADELFMEERFEHQFRLEGFATIARGYSSWNAVQFERVAATIDAKPGDVVFFFPMANDFTPDYSRSVVRTDTAPKTDESRQLPVEPLMSSYSQQSFLRNRFAPLVERFFAAGDKPASSSAPIRDSHDSRNWTDCNSLPELADVASKLAHNYLELSKQSSCWSERVRESVDMNLVILRNTVAALRASEVETHVALVPAGWAFENQNTVGRTAALYQFPVGLKVTHEGLYDYLVRGGLPMLDLMTVLEPEALENDDLYFAVDGHWNERGHRVVFDGLLNVVEKRG